MMRMRMTIIKPPPISHINTGISLEGGFGVGEDVVEKDTMGPFTERPPATGCNASAL